MEDTDPAAASRTQTRQPKKRFVGRRTADAQSQNEASTNSDTTVQKGISQSGGYTLYLVVCS
jgi:2-(3-amino-3-carboxypropyl)histidine synthase